MSYSNSLKSVIILSAADSSATGSSVQPSPRIHTVRHPAFRAGGEDPAPRTDYRPPGLGDRLGYPPQL